MSKPPARSVLRILALPVRRTPTPLTYYHVLQKLPSASTEGDTKPSYAKRAIIKATELWDSWGSETRPPTSWQRRAYAYGTKAMDAVPFEESALKAVIVPKTNKTAPTSKDDAGTAELVHLTNETALEVKTRWAAFLQERIPLHRGGMIRWALIAPLTTPFMLVPLIPNLPFFFCAWRAWSPYQAWNGAKYLNTLSLTTSPNTELDAIMSAPDAPSETKGEEKVSLDSTSETSSTPDSSPSPPHPEPGLLTPTRAGLIARTFALAPHSHSDLLRSIAQATKRTEKEARR